MKKFLIIGLVIVSTSVVLFVFYQSLGGMSDIQPALVNTKGYHLSGRYYKGKNSSQQHKQLFYEIKKYKRPVFIINYPLASDSTERGYVHQFIGVENSKMADNVYLENISIVSTKAVRVTIDSHNLVMPKPNVVEAKIRDFASKKNLQLENYTIEKYVSERELTIEIPLKD